MQAEVVYPLIKELQLEELIKLYRKIGNVIDGATPKKIIKKQSNVLTEEQAIENLFRKGHLKR